MGSLLAKKESSEDKSDTLTDILGDHTESMEQFESEWSDKFTRNFNEIRRIEIE